MANQVQYRIGFSADTSAAKSSLRELETSLKKISTIHLDSFIDDVSLKSAAKAAQDLQAHLHKAVNVDTGKLNLSAFNASLQKSNQSVTSLANDLLNAGNAGSQAFVQLARSIAAAEVPIKKVNSTLASIGQTLKNTVKWELSSSFVHGIEGAFSNALGYVKNLNTSLTNIRIVTGASVEEMARFAEQANIAAKALSTTTKAYADASLIYYQQGDSAEQAAKKAAITIKATNASFNTSAAEMSEYLTAVWNSYQVGADELERYVDIMAALGAKTATSLEEIATSMQKVAATANTVGVSMEQVSSIISTVSSVTRESAESIGTSYKTIFARIGDLKLGGTTEDGLGLGQVSSALESIGIEILDSSNNLRDMGDIITDLGTKWQVMNEAQKTAIAQVVAGKRQYTQLMALFENWDMYNKNLNIAEGAEGELQKMQDIYAESWESASARVTASIEGIYNSLLNDQSMIKMLGIVEVLVEAIDGFIKGMGGLPGIIMSVGGALGNAFAPEIASQITNIGVKIKDIFTNNNSEQQKFLETNRQMRAELAALAKDSAVLGLGQQTEINGLINVSEAKDKLIQSSKNLSQAQIAEIESAISGYQQEIERIAQLQQSMDKLEADRTKAAADLQKIILQDDVKAVQRIDGESTIEHRQRAFREANKGMLQDAEPLSLEVEFDETGLQAFAQSCGKTVDEIKEDFGTVGSALNTIFSKNIPDNISALLSKSEEFVTSITNATNLGAYLQQVFVETGSVLDNSSASTDDIANDLQNAINKAEALANALGETFSAEFLQLKSIPINLNTEEGKKQARELATVLQEELDRMVQMAGPKAAALKAILVKITPPEYKAEVEALWASWAKGSITLQELEERAKKLGINFDKAIKQMTSSTESLPQKLTKLGSGISSLASMFNSLSHAWDTLKNPDVSGWQKFMAVLGGVSSILMGLKSVMDAGKVIQNAYNVLLAIGVGLEVADAAAKRDGAQAQAEKNKEVLKGIALEASDNTIKGMSNGEKAVTALKGFGKVASEAAVAFAGMAKTALVVAGPYIALAAAVAAVGVAIWAVVTAEDRYKKALDEKAEALKKARQENQEEISKLTNDTASLDAIMRDTTLTYEEQIEQINKIAAAYGVQATAVDALTNSYSKFANKMIAVNQTQARKNAQTASTNANTARSIVDGYLDRETDVFDDMYDLDTNYGLLMHSGISPTGYYTWEEYNAWAQNDALREWKENEDWYTGQYGTYDEFYANEYSTSAAEYYSNSRLFSDAESTREAQVIWEQNGYGSGLLFDDFNSKKLSKREELFTDGEKALWESEEFGDKLNSYGFYFDKNDLALRNMYGVEQDWAGLLEFLQKQGYGEDSYTGSVAQILEDAHIGELISAEQEAANASAIDALWHNDSFLSNIYNPNATTVSLKDTQNLIESIGSNVETNAAIADVLSQYGAYENTATVLGSVYKLADQSVDMVDLDIGIDAENIKRDVVQQLMLAFPELDVETVLKLTPKDIIVNEDGTVSISDAVRDYINASVVVNKQQGIQSTIDENYSLLTKDVLSEADYREIMALADAGKLGDDFDADTFGHQDADTRRAEIERRRAEANEQELAALNAQIVAAEQRAEEYKEQFKSWESNFNSIHGEDAYKSIQSKIAADTAARDELQAKITQAENGAQIDWTALGYDDIEAARKQVDTYNESIATNNALIEDGIVLETAWSGAASDRQQAQMDLNSSEYQQWADNVQRATEVAEAFSDALNNQGQVSKETLALLSQYDSNALNNYQNMSNSEWMAYAYENAMNYYAKLEKLYADDALALIAITQEKQTLQEEYYNTLKTQAEETLKYIQEKAKEETDAIQNAISLLNNIDFSEGLSALGVDGLEELRQALMEVYEDADAVDAMIRNIGKEKVGSKEAAIALADAKTALALKGHEALLNEQAATRSLIGYSAAIEEIEPPLYEDDGLIKTKTENGEILTQIKGMPDNIFINDKGELIQLDPATGTYTILGDAASSVFLTSDGELKTVNPATGTYHIIDNAKNAQFFNENGTLKVRTAYGTYTVQDVNSTDFFTDQGVLPGKTADGTYTITSQNASVFFDSATGKLKPDLNGSGQYTVSAISGNTNVLVAEGSSLKLVSITDGNAAFEVNLTGSSETGAGTLSVVDGVVTLNSVTADGEIQASLLPGSYGGIIAGEDGSISFSDIDPNSPQAQTFIQIAGQAGLGITTNAEGTGFTIVPPTTPAVDPVIVSAEAGDGVSGTGTEGDSFVVDIDVADKHQRILVSYVEENYSAINDRLYRWQNLSQKDASSYLGGTGFQRNEKGRTKETRDSLRSLGGGGLEDALDLAYESYNGDFLRMYSEDVTGRNMARQGTQALSTEVTAWYKQTQDYWMEVFKGYNNQMELVEAKMAEEIAALGENSGISLLFDMMQAEMSLGSSGNIMNLFKDYYDKDGNLVQSAQDSALQYVELWMDSFEGSLQDGTMEDSAIFLIQGLVKGLQGNTEMLTKVAEMLGFTTIEAMNKALGIASPSRYTMEMGYWLIQGLSKGFQNTEFDPGDFGTSVMNRIKESLKDVDMAEIWASAGFGYNDLTADEFKSMAQGGTLNQGQKEQILKNWNKTHEDDVYNSYDELYIAQGVDNILGSTGILEGVRGTTVKSREQILQEKYGLGTKLRFMQNSDTDKWGVEVFDEATNDWIQITDQMYDTVEAAQDAFIASEYAREKTVEYLDGGFFADETLTDAQKIIMEEIIAKAVQEASDGQYSDIRDYLAQEGNSIETLMPYLNDTYADYQADLTSAVDLSWAKIKATWINTLEECAEIDAEMAEQTYERWVTAWEAIGKARVAALTGGEGSLADQWSKDEQLEMARRMQASGMGLEEIVATQLSGTYDTNADYLQLGTYASSGRGDMSDLIGLNINPNGLPIDTTLDQYKTNTTNYWHGWATDTLSTSQFFSHTADYERAAQAAYGSDGALVDTDTYLSNWAASLNKNVKELTTAEREAALSYRETATTLVGGGVMTKEDGSWHMSEDNEEIVTVYVNSKTDETVPWEDNYSEAIAAGAQSVIGYVTDYKTQLIEERDATVNKYEADRELVQKALDGEKLSKEEQKQVDALIKEYGSLENANLGLAKKIDQTITAFDRMIAALENGYTKIDENTWAKVGEATRVNKEESFDSFDAANAAYGGSLGQEWVDNGDGTYTQTTAIEDPNNPGHYYVVTRTTEAIDEGTDEWEDLAPTYTGTYDEATRPLTAEETFAEVQSWGSQLSALDAYQLDPSTTNLAGLAEAINWADDNQVQAYNDIASAITSEERQAAIERMTAAIVDQSDATLTHSEATQALLDKYAEEYGIVDENGQALSTATLNMRRLTQAEKEAIKQNAKFIREYDKGTKKIKRNGKTYNNFIDALTDIRKEAKAAERNLDDYVDSLDDLSDAEKEALKFADKLVAGFENIEGITPEFAAELAERCLESEDMVAEALDGMIEHLWEANPNLEDVFDNMLAQLSNGTINFSNSAIDMINQAGLDVETCMTSMQAALEAAGGDWTAVDWGTLSNTLGVDMSFILALLEELLGAYAAANNIESLDLSGIISQIHHAMSAAAAVQGNWGGAGGGVNNTSTPKVKNNATTPSGGGGGGGGGDIQQKNKKEYDDEIERYHEIQEEMKRTNEALNQIEKHKERAFGKKYLDLMDQEISKLKENIAEQRRYQDEIAGYLAQDRQAAAALGAEFDAEGNITNYTQVMQSIIDDYNAAVEQYNAGNMTDEEFEDIEEQYDDAMEALEQYEETLELSAEAQEEFLELQNQLSEANLEKITYKMEIVTELNDADLEILEYYQDLYEDNLDKQDDLMRNLTQQAKEYESNILVLNDAMAQLQAKFASGEINEADFAEGMQELRDQAIGYAGDLEDLKEQIVETYENALDLAAEEVQNFTEKMQDSADMMDTYISLTQLMGRGTNYRELEKFYDTQYKANLANLETQRAYVDSLEEQAKYFEDQIAAGMQLTETEQEQYEALQDALREANSELASTTEAALSSIQAAYENSINAIFKELDESIAGTAGSLADLADQYAYYQEEQSRYVSTAKELYEVSKLNRSIEQSLEDATTDASKAKLKALQEEINLISEKNDLSEYDIEMMNLQYQLTLAQIALEEAQASKDTVRLTRDQDGNIAYQYTANQEKVSQAQQQYEDVLQQINDLASNRVSELEQQCLDAEQQYLQSAQEILLDTTLTDEQRTKKLEELSQRYSETLLFIQGQYNNASQALTQNQQAVAEHYGQALVNSMGEASTQMNEVIGGMIGNAQSHIDAFNQAIEEGSMGAWSDYMAGVSALTNASGLTYDNLIANADDYTEVAETANQAAQDLISTFTDSFDDINSATEQWDAHLATLEGVQTMYENIAQSAQAAVEAVSGFTGEDGVGDTTSAIARLLGINTEDLTAYERPPVVLDEETQMSLQGWTEDYLNEIMCAYVENIAEYAEASSGVHAGGGGSAIWSDKIELQEYQMIQQSMMEQLHNFYAAQDGFAHASGYGVASGGGGSLEQHVEIVADFPNATDQNEIRMAFEELINLASQHVYSSAALQKNY